MQKHKRSMFQVQRLGLYATVAAFVLLTAQVVVAAPQAAPKAAAPQAAAAAEPAPAPQPTGNSDVGRQYFTGEKQFASGAPACISCHTAGNHGALGGGSLGPDLTNIMANEAKAGAVHEAWINGGGSPVMAPIFAARNVTTEEVDNVRAYLESVKTQNTSSTSGTFFGYGIVGTVVMLVIFSIIWSNRYRKRNQGTAHDDLWRNYGGKGGR